MQYDQGLTAEDQRVFNAFSAYVAEGELPPIFKESKIQPGGKVLIPPADNNLTSFCEVLGVDTRYAEVFCENDDAIFGEKFFIYTTFSESQVDVNPITLDGFKLIIDDLFHLLDSGELAMMRMDAIKYLWKEIGKKNFDMPEGNRLIEVIRLLISLTSPVTLPLDEVNSPDPVVYQMGKDGGFAYLFGQVNAVPAAFNSGSLEPIDRFFETMDTHCPEDLVLFVMLGTHDGRSAQGLGVDRTDGHVSIAGFDRLKKTIEGRGGRVKDRSVPFTREARVLNTNPLTIRFF